MSLSDDKFLDAIDRMQGRASVERKEQTILWTAALDALRKDFRIAGVLMLVTICALAGIQVAAQNGAFKFNVTPATVHTSVGVEKVSSGP